MPSYRLSISIEAWVAEDSVLQAAGAAATENISRTKPGCRGQRPGIRGNEKINTCKNKIRTQLEYEAAARRSQEPAQLQLL